MPVACPSCRNPVTEPYLIAPDYTTGERFQLWKCSRCKVVHTSAPGNLGAYYQPQYRRYGPLVLKVLEALYNWRVSTWARGFSHPGLALEVGCGPGYMMAALRRRGWRTIGFERNAEVLHPARIDQHLDVFAGDINSLASRPTFDLIVLFQVLEHLTDPQSTLAECVRRLRPNGRIVIGVPNLGSWQAQFAGKEWFHLDTPRHLFHFTPESLEGAIRRAGCEPVAVRFVSWEHDPYGWVQSILNRIGFEQNLLTRLLMRMRPQRSGLAAIAATIVLAALLAPFAALASLFSWICGRGAIMEMQARQINAAGTHGTS